MQAPGHRLAPARAAVFAVAVTLGAGSAAAAPAGGPGSPAPLLLTLPAAVARALAHTPDAAALDARLAQEAAAVRIALAAVLPVLAVTGTYTRVDQGVTFGGSTVVSEDELSVEGALGVTLFRPRALGDWLVSRAGLDVARSSLAFDRETLALATAQAWLAVLRADALLAAAAETVERRAAFVRAAEARLERGVTDRSEGQRAALSLLAARAERVRLEADRDVAREALAVLVAAPPGAPLALVDDAAAEGPPVGGPDAPDLPDAPEAAERAALARRLDVRALRRAVERDETARTWAWLDFLPELELAAGFVQGPTSFRDPDGFSWQIQLRAVFTLYDGGARYGRLERVTATRALDDAALAAAEARVGEEVRTALLRTAQLGVELALAGETLTLARQVRTDVERRLQSGLGTLLDVLTAEDQLAQAQLRVRSLAFDLRIARWRLAHASGTLLESLGP
jgi:outer membrane protein TolC